ncbi:MAG: CpsB/CapC family capsule biosynthesis tyrosine phosphatase [Candidatus Cloacimonadales bacterium]|nr:capsular biosynthesis protein [Candidatus Cloacimonadota bacterium]MDD3501242.1 capsular biosynthesis protein [Candidatus Cloacimonadota bacterium]MDX9977536.1 CpsB/CapC family capsule biosynthesis tyrosine phosphatase [Candidatus Cloacimonadales bacterium]
MIDIHNHILPGLDDGAKDIETTIEYLKLIQESGVKKLVFTPHYMPGFYESTHKAVSSIFKDIMKIKDDYAPDVHFYHSAEVYLNGENIIDDIIKENLFINNSQYVLVENNLNGFTEDLYQLLYQMTRKGMKPILAHPERYQEIKENPIKADDFLQRDVYLQINTGSILGGYGKQVQDTAFELIDRGWVHFLGSDCHCRSMVYDFPEAVDAIRHEFDNKMAELLSQTFPEKMLNNEHLPHFYMVRKETPKKKSFLEKMLDFFGE